MTPVSSDEDFFAVILPAVMTVASTCNEERRGRAVVRQRMHWRVHAERLLLEGEFKQYYRMSFAGFERLFCVLGLRYLWTLCSQLVELLGSLQCLLRACSRRAFVGWQAEAFTTFEL